MLALKRSASIGKTIRRLLAATPVLWRYKGLLEPRFPGTAEYWERRYEAGGDSGRGSYGQLAAFKAEVLNAFVAEHELKTIVDLGCGDGSQLSLAAYPKYIGFDISRHAITTCRDRFKDDSTKSFFVYNSQFIRDSLSHFAADLSISLDVIYHLVEDDMFEDYMHTLLLVSKRYIAIYSSNHDELKVNSHERHRKFTTFVESKFPCCALYRTIEQRYPLNKYGRDGSLSNFYFFKKFN